MNVKCQGIYRNIYFITFIKFEATTFITNKINIKC